MKSFALTILFLSTLSQAQQVTPPTDANAPVAAPIEQTLKAVMKDMSTKLKAIAAQSTDATKNASSEDLSNQLVASIEQAKALFPKSATDAASQDEYVKMIVDVQNLAKELALAFHNNDNQKAADILNQLSQAKKDGHTKFK